jgi:hypothetical protein
VIDGYPLLESSNRILQSNENENGNGKGDIKTIIIKILFLVSLLVN